MLFFGKIPLIMHCKQGDVQVKLLDVAYVPGVQFNMFSLHAIMPKCSVSLDAEGVHMLDGVLPFLRRDAGSFVEATRVVETPIATAVLAPGRMRRIDIKDLHVSLAHSHADTLPRIGTADGNQSFWGVGSVCWVFQDEGEEDGGTVDDGVPFHEASGASLRGSIGVTS